MAFTGRTRMEIRRPVSYTHLIGGNVKSGFVVKSSGSITVQGIVEAATLVSGGDIVIKGGVSGASKGRLEAENDVVTSYMERSEVSAGGNVISGSVLHCRVVCELSLIHILP